MNHTIVHFEIPGRNLPALANFYNKLFGWKLEKDQGNDEYWQIETAPQGQGVNGGMIKRDMEEQTPLYYIQVESVAEFIKKVEGLGGDIVVPRQVIPGIGYFAIGLDPEGNPFGLWETNAAAA